MANTNTTQAFVDSVETGSSVLMHTVQGTIALSQVYSGAMSFML